MIFMKKYLIFLLFLCSSCVKYNQIDNQNLDIPSWYVKPAQNDAQYLYGIGEGFTIQEASRASLNNAASKLIVTISSESSSRLEENKYSFNEQYQQKIQEKVQNITFNDYQIANSHRDGNKFYVQIQINRHNFVKEQNSILSQNHKIMRNIYNASKSQNILIRRRKLDEINDLVQKTAIINQILNSLNVNKNYQSNLNKYQFYQDSSRDILNKIEFFINSDSNKVKNVIIKILNDDGLKIATVKNKNKNLVIINIKHNVSYKNIYGSKIASLKVKFKFISPQGKILASNIIEVSGASVTDNKDALSSAIKNLAQKINKEGILQF